MTTGKCALRWQWRQLKGASKSGCNTSSILNLNYKSFPYVIEDCCHWYNISCQWKFSSLQDTLWSIKQNKEFSISKPASPLPPPQLLPFTRYFIVDIDQNQFQRCGGCETCLRTSSPKRRRLNCFNENSLYRRVVRREEDKTASELGVGIRCSH